MTRHYHSTSTPHSLWHRTITMYPEDYRRTRVWRVFSLLLAFTGGAIFYEVGMLYGLIHPVAEPLSAVQLLDRSRTAVGSLASQRELLVDLAIPGAAVAPSNPVMPKAPLNYSHDSNVIKDAAAPDIQKAAQSTDELCPITCTISGEWTRTLQPFWIWMYT